MVRVITLVVVSVVTLVACADRADDAATEAQTQPEPTDARQPAGQQGFVMLRGNDTLAVERYSRSGEALEGELIDSGSGDRLTYRATVDGDGRITRIELAAHSSGGGAAEQRATGEFRGDTLVSESWEGDGERDVQRLVTPANTYIVIANSTATIEPLVRRFRSEGTDEAQYSVVLIGGSDSGENRPQQARLRRLPGDSVQLSLGGEQMARAAVDAQGNIQGAVSADGGVRIVRTGS